MTIAVDLGIKATKQTKHNYKLTQDESFSTLKAPITTAADNKFWDIFPIFHKNKLWYYMRIVCQQTILMKYHALFVIFDKAAKFELSSAANYRWRFKG